MAAAAAVSACSWHRALVPVPLKLHPRPAHLSAHPLHCRFDKVHALQAGLWGRTANITLESGRVGFEWGNVFREAKAGEQGIPAYSVNASVMCREGKPGWVDAGRVLGVLGVLGLRVGTVQSTHLAERGCPTIALLHPPPNLYRRTLPGCSTFPNGIMSRSTSRVRLLRLCHVVWRGLFMAGVADAAVAPGTQ